MIWPRLGADAPEISRSNVDFPHPLGPVTRTSCPAPTSAWTSRSTQGPLTRYRFPTPSSLTRPP